MTSENNECNTVPKNNECNTVPKNNECNTVPKNNQNSAITENYMKDDKFKMLMVKLIINANRMKELDKERYILIKELEDHKMSYSMNASMNTSMDA